MGKDDINDIIGEQYILKNVEYEYDKNGKIREKQTRAQKALEFVSDFATVDPAGGGADEDLCSITIAAGNILEIYNVVCTSETGAKPFAIATTTGVAFADPLSGVAGYNLLWGALITGAQVIADKDKTPFLVIDNSGGSVPLYVWLYSPDDFMDAVHAATEDVSAFLSGYKYTP